MTTTKLCSSTTDTGCDDDECGYLTCEWCNGSGCQSCGWTGHKADDESGEPIPRPATAAVEFKDGTVVSVDILDHWVSEGWNVWVTVAEWAVDAHGATMSDVVSVTRFDGEIA